jgi:DNA-directed RNA polymerase subunit M/transcription elongation factor TFIIS
MMNFINAIPENLGWVIVGAVGMLTVILLADIIKMAVIGIKGRLEKDEDEILTSSNGICPLCGRAEEPYAEKSFEEGYKCKFYECNECGTKWSEEEL